MLTWLTKLPVLGVSTNDITSGEVLLNNQHPYARPC